MTKPDSFIVTTYYPTLKNDGVFDATVAIPSSVSVPRNGYVEYHTDIVAGTQGAVASARISSSKDSGIWYQAQTIVYTRMGSDIMGPSLYSIAAFVWRPSPTVLRCQVHIPNPLSNTLTGEAGAETISFHVNTFIPPFA